jgi:hypothetical protein
MERVLALTGCFRQTIRYLYRPVLPELIKVRAAIFAFDAASC